jgi:hypothetical protein
MPGGNRLVGFRAVTTAVSLLEIDGVQDAATAKPGRHSRKCFFPKENRYKIEGTRID